MLKKLSWPGFDIISFGYDHIPKSVTCAFLSSPFFTAGLFLYGISLFWKHTMLYETLCVLPTHTERETICTLHGISNVVEATWEYRFITPGTQGIAMHHGILDCSELMEYAYSYLPLTENTLYFK